MIDELLNKAVLMAEGNHPVSPQIWLDLAQKLNSLRGTLDNQLADFEFQIMERKAKFIEEGQPVTKAEILAKNDPEYLKYLKAKAKSERIIEAIRISKLQARNEF